MSDDIKVRGIRMNDIFWERVQKCADYLGLSSSAFVRLASAELVHKTECKIETEKQMYDQK